LQRAGMSTVCLADGLEVVPWLKANRVDLVVLDLMLPGQDGMEVCREIRSFSQVPIIMLTARIEKVDRILGLERGADDYICKPADPDEVVARVKAVLRRGDSQAPTPPPASGLILDPDRITAIIDGQPIALTLVEYNLLRILMTSHGRILTRKQIMEQLYDDHRTVSDRSIDCYIKNLRKKLAEADPTANFIQSVYGLGYRFDFEPVPGSH
ncbi:MAG: winged helix-turn-helix domain-containing protein, partial [Desulfobulbaceae bacterium]|nr:winged helix-turn-helix domain-containing protein [Desulfobulbaceae bacterium]